MNPKILRFAALILAVALTAAAAITILTRPSPEVPTLTITAETILNATTGAQIPANVYLNGTLVHKQVTHFQVTVPLDGSTEIRIAAPGYHPWAIVPRGGGADKVLSGPVRLTPK